MIKKTKDMVIGTVRTNKVGSGCDFDVCLRGDWDVMSVSEQQETLIASMWDSGLLDVFPANAEFKE